MYRLILMISACFSIGATVNLDDFKVCNAAAIKDFCVPGGPNQRFLEIAVNCNDVQWANFAANLCARDSQSGASCLQATVGYAADIFAITTTCAAPIRDSSDTCSTDCRNRLAEIRNELGCCINIIFNRSDNAYEPLNQLEIFDYSLWSSCNVEPAPPASTCEGGLTFTIPANQQETCTYSELQTIWLKEACSQAAFDGFTDYVRESPRCQIYLDYFTGLCSLDESGNFCTATENSTYDYDLYILPFLANGCATNTQSCSPTCKSLLQGFVSDRGCCVNAHYNSNFAVLLGHNYSTSSFLADNTMFESCAVEAPSLTCALPFSGCLQLKGFFLMPLLSIIIIVMTLEFGNKI